MQLELYAHTGYFTEIIAEVSESIEAGKSNATLLGWEDDETPEPTRTISAAVMAFSDAGWKWSDAHRQLEKDGWLIWFRSQGVLSSPIIQWSRIQ